MSNGSGSFKSYRPKMVLTDHTSNEVTIPLLNPNETSYWVAITHLSMAAEIKIGHVETYGTSADKNAMDAERAPRLHANGTWDVSKGEMEFKDEEGDDD